MKRRTFFHAALATTVSGVFLANESAAESKAVKNPRLLLRSSWQTVNIGDVAHSPGVLALIEKHLPEAETILWASSSLSNEIAGMLRRRFPKLKIVKGTIGADGIASNTELRQAIQWSDFLIHGSGPSLVAANDLAAFAKHTKKPYGVYGITQSAPIAELHKRLLSEASFAFFRDSVSLNKAKSAGISCPIMAFGPDGAFACDLRDDETASSFLEANGLQSGKFVCCIPRLRNTPYWKIHGKPMDDAAGGKHERNESMADKDHAPLRDAISAIVRQTDMKVLICPEDMSQMAVGKRWVIDKLPLDVLPSVVWRETFWMTDEASSVYVRSAGLFGLEMHSPIMCIGNGVPAIVCRFNEQTSKGFMWNDIGLNDWLFDFEKRGGADGLTEAVLAMVNDPLGAIEKVKHARARVQQRQRETMAILSKQIAG